MRNSKKQLSFVFRDSMAVNKNGDFNRKMTSLQFHEFGAEGMLLYVLDELQLVLGGL